MCTVRWKVVNIQGETVHKWPRVCACVSAVDITAYREIALCYTDI